MHILLCPQCKSPSITQYAGGITGTYQCKKCGYIGTLVIEKTDFPEMKNEQD